MYSSGCALDGDPDRTAIEPRAGRVGVIRSDSQETAKSRVAVLEATNIEIIGDDARVDPGTRLRVGQQLAVVQYLVSHQHFVGRVPVTGIGGNLPRPVPHLGCSAGGKPSGTWIDAYIPSRKAQRKVDGGAAFSDRKPRLGWINVGIRGTRTGLEIAKVRVIAQAECRGGKHRP